MYSGIVASSRIYKDWSWVVELMQEIWERDGNVESVVLDENDNNSNDVFKNKHKITRIVCFYFCPDLDFLNALSNLKEIALTKTIKEKSISAETLKEIERRNISLYKHESEGYWKESVAECALALTINALKRIPQLYHRLLQKDKSIWDYQTYSPRTNKKITLGPRSRSNQYSDDFNFAGGTISGKRVRIVGAGNIGSHYAKIVKLLGADVSVYDPFAPDPSVLLTGAKRETKLDRLVKDAQIFVPMIPSNDKTRGLITRDLIYTLPKGCLVVLITRAIICDMEAVRERVLNDEISLAADVMDIEPLPDDDPLIGRDNVIITPHIAGRTYYSNKRYVELLAEKFSVYTK